LKGAGEGNQLMSGIQKLARSLSIHVASSRHVSRGGKLSDSLSVVASARRWIARTP
jgi:hypothetical protein